MAHIMTARRLLATVAVAATIPLWTACGSGTTPPSAGSDTPAATSTTAAATSNAAPADNAYCTALESGQKELESISSKISDTAALEQGKAVLVKIEAAAPAEVKQAWGDTSALSAATAKMEASGATIEQHAKQTCNLDIS